MHWATNFHTPATAKLEHHQHREEADKVTDCPFAVAPEKVVQRQAGGPFVGFKATENNADDQRDFVELQSKRYRGNIRARRSCLTSVRAVKFALLAFFGFVHHRKTDKNFRHTFLFQAETNVVIFSQTLHVESNTVTVS